MPDLPNLVWLRAFEASARLHSFTAAAEELGLTQAAVSHQVRSLEKDFGVALFVRRSRHLELTQLGHAYYPTIAQALEDISFSTRGLIGPAKMRTVTLRAPISTAVLWIAPRLGAFHAAHPQIKIRLISAIWADSTSDDDVDVDLRLGPPGWFEQRGHFLASETVVPVAAPDIAARLNGPQDLASQTLIHIHGFQDHWLRLSTQEDIALATTPSSLFVDTSLAAIELAASGAGVAMIMKRYAQDQLTRGRLAQVGTAEVPMGQGHYLMPPHGDGTQNNEAALVRNWLTQLFQS